MREAKFHSEDQPVCYSRQIGCVIVNPALNSVVATGYNGAPRKTEHPDSYTYLKEYFWPQLTTIERIEAVKNI